MERKRLLWMRLAASFAVETLFMALVLPAFARDSTYVEEVWKDFGTATGAVLVLYLIWPVLRWGGWQLRIGGAVLCFLPLWIIAWVILQHFDLVPRWFS